MKNIGGILKTIRIKRGWGQKDVAKFINISIPAFSKIETGITDMNLSRLEQFAELFEMSIKDLINYGQADNHDKFDDELDNLNNKLAKLDAEVIDLQRKMISLLDEISLQSEKK
jgi:transcriptional regulator with XRE-family HTH domain